MGAFSGSGGNKHRVSTMAAKAGYIFIIALSAILALILYTYGDQISWLNDIPAISDICTNKGTTASQCYGASAVLRISLALCLFMTLNLLTCFSGDFFVGLWAVKVVVWLGLLIGMFFIPADAVEKYGQTARIFSILFIIAMALLLVDFAYHLQEVLVSKIEATHAQLKEKFADIGCCQNLWRWLYVGLVSALLIGSFIGIVLLYKFSANRPEGVQCGQNMGFLSATLVTGLIYLILSPLEWLGGSRGMLTPALIFAYCTWLCWSAIYANPNAQCNPVPPDTSNTGATIVGMLIAAGSLCYTAFSASRNLPHMFDMSAKKQAAIAAGHLDEEEAGPDSTPLTAGAVAPAVSGAAKKGTGEESDEEEEGRAAAYAGKGKDEAAELPPPPYSALSSAIFVIIMILASMYMAPVITNWVTDASDVVASRSSPAAMWVQIGSQWAVIALYLWTLVAPMCCPGRDFS